MITPAGHRRVSLVTRCRICISILGRGTLCRSEETCPLKQASYCSQCAHTGHFLEQCDYKAKEPTTTIESVSPEVKPSVFTLRDDPITFRTFLFKHKMTMYRFKEDITKEERRKVEEKMKRDILKYLQEEGLEVRWEPTEWTTKKIGKKKKDASQQSGPS